MNGPGTRRGDEDRAVEGGEAGRALLGRAAGRLATARARLVVERPFLGALSLHLSPQAVDESVCDTMGTDGRWLFFNPAFVAALPAAEAQFLVAHVALHCGLGHFARGAHRLRRRWDAACDHAVNHLLRDDGLRPPAWALCDPAFAGMTAEEIYPLIPEDTRDTPRDRHGPANAGTGSGLGGWLGERRAEAVQAAAFAAAAGEGGTPVRGLDEQDDSWDDAGNAARRHPPAAVAVASPPGSAEAPELLQLWRAHVAAAAQAARQAGRLGDSWARRLERLIEPALPWRALLARHVMSAARDDYSFSRPRRRDGPALFPRLASGSLRLVAALDTSGSITDAELAGFAAELEALKAQVQAELVVHACDEHLAEEGPWRFPPWEPVRLPQRLCGGGGTRFTPVFEWIEREGLRPDLLVYFTDAQGEFPAEAPDYPVLWLVKGRADVPFGERVALG